MEGGEGVVNSEMNWISFVVDYWVRFLFLGFFFSFLFDGLVIQLFSRISIQRIDKF